jgi:hypothetical protein
MRTEVKTVDTWGHVNSTAGCLYSWFHGSPEGSGCFLTPLGAHKKKWIYAAEMGSQTWQDTVIYVLPRVKTGGKKGAKCLSLGIDPTSQAAK